MHTWCRDTAAPPCVSCCGVSDCCGTQSCSRTAGRSAILGYGLSSWRIGRPRPASVWLGSSGRILLAGWPPCRRLLGALCLCVVWCDVWRFSNTSWRSHRADSCTGRLSLYERPCGFWCAKISLSGTRTQRKSKEWNLVEPVNFISVFKIGMLLLSGRWIIPWCIFNIHCFFCCTNEKKIPSKCCLLCSTRLFKLVLVKPHRTHRKGSWTHALVTSRISPSRSIWSNYGDVFV